MRSTQLTALSIGLFLVAMSGVALNNRSAVSINGLDTNACTVAAPCRTFTTALSATASGGEVVALDSAGYGPFAIAQDVTVVGAPGAHAAITALSGDAIDVGSGVDATIDNLTIVGGPMSLRGIRDQGAARLHVTRCFITGLSAGTGIQTTETSPGSQPATLIDHTTFDFSFLGVDFADSTGAVTSCSFNYDFNAVNVESVTDVADVSIIDSTVNGSQIGVNATGVNGIVRILRCSLANSTLVVEGSAGHTAFLLLHDNYFESVTGTGQYQLLSYGNNAIRNLTATLTPLPLQ